MQAWLPRTLLTAALLLLLAPRPAAAELLCAELPTLMQQFLKHHVLHWTLDEQLEARTLDTYLRREDPSRTLLTKADEQAIEASMRGVFKRIEAGDCTPLKDLHKSLTRHQERTAKYVRAFVGSDSYKLDEKPSLVLD